MSSEIDEDDKKSTAVRSEKIEEVQSTKPKKGHTFRIKKDCWKKNTRHEKAWEEYCKFMNANLEKKRNYHESPHILIGELQEINVISSIFLISFF